MNTKQKLSYMVIGGMIGVAGMVIGMSAMPLSAQRDKFDTIQCKRLEVVDAEGTTRVVIADTIFAAGLIQFVKKRGVAIGVDGISCHGSNGLTLAGLYIGEDGGRVYAIGKDGKSMSVLGVDEHGGLVDAMGKDGISGVALGIDEAGGIVVAYGKDGKSQAGLAINEHGGRIGVLGKDRKSAVSLGIDEDGGFVGKSDRYGSPKLLD